MAKRKIPNSAVRLGPTAVKTSSSSLSQLNLEPGTILFEQWKIRRERRRGGHGVVFEAEEILLRERQAVKILDPVLMARTDMLERFRREVTLMRGFSHPHILKVFDYREDTKRQLALISMEYVEGGTVRDLLDLARQRQAQVPLMLSLRILFQALDALAEAHAKEIVHRDIAPGNILLAGGSSHDLLRDPLRDPEVKLLDFGIAGLVDKIRRSQEGEGLGTASYAAPEVFHPEEKVTPATDIYSLGAVVWELTTGHIPTVSSPRPSETQQGAPTELDEFLLALMDTTAAQRPNSESARARAAELLEQVGSSAHIPSSTDKVGHPVVRWGIGLAAALALVMGLMNRPIAGTSQESADGVEMATNPPESVPTDLPLEKNPDLVVPPPDVKSPEFGPSEVGAEARSPGVYLKVDSVAGTRLTATLLESVASRGESTHDERPLDFENHLQGACLNRAISSGERLEWTDLDLCNEPQNLSQQNPSAIFGSFELERFRRTP